MRLSIQHSTRYQYTSPPSSAVEVLRLTPSNTGTQSVRDWRIFVSGDAPLQRFEDAFGNITHIFSSNALGDSLVVTATGTVDTSSTSGVMSGTRERLPLGVYLRETSLTEPNAPLRALANEAVASSDGTALDLAHRLNRMINERIEFDPIATHASTTAGESLQAARGVCQDLSHILLACARTAKLPARYVSGYQFEDGRARDDHASHAWAEIYIEGLGWVGFDPTAGGSTNETYVRVAVGLDYLSASPVRGAIYGGTGEHLDVTVTMDEGGGWQSRQRQQQQSQAQ